MNKCFLRIHDWSDWEDFKTESIIKEDFSLGFGISKENIGMMLVQMRRCRKCKKVELNNIKTK